MPRTTGFSTYLLAIVAIPAIWSPAQAADEETQFWLAANRKFDLGDHAQASLDVSLRAREGSDLLLNRVSADFDLSDNFRLGGGMTYLEYSGGRELRPHQQVSLGAGFLSSRTRLEERFMQGTRRAQIRLRERVQASFPLDRSTTLKGSGEIFYILQSEYRANDPQPVRWRAIGEFEHRLNRRILGGVGYQLTYLTRHGASTEVSHLPRIRLTVLL